MQILDTSVIPASQPSLNVSTIPEKDQSAILGTAIISHGTSAIPDEQGHMKDLFLIEQNTGKNIYIYVSNPTPKYFVFSMHHITPTSCFKTEKCAIPEHKTPDIQPAGDEMDELDEILEDDPSQEEVVKSESE